MSAKSSNADQLKQLKAENAKLKAENQRLNKSVAESKTKKNRRLLDITRRTAVILLVSIAVALLAVGNVLFWIGNTVVKQDRFVAATQPIIKNTEVQQSLALYTTNQLFNNVDVQQITEQVLPPRADFLAPQLTAQLKTGTQTVLEKALANPSFQDKWNTILANQHQRLINFSAGYTGSGQISINDIYNQLSASLATTKLSFLANKTLPSNVGSITVVSAPWLPTFHNIVTHIDQWRILAIVIILLALAGAIWLSRNRRRTVYLFSIFSAFLMLATLVALHITRQTIVGEVDPQYASGVQQVIQIVFHSLVVQTVLIMIVAILIAAVAWVSGNSRGAKGVKRQVDLLFSGKLHTRLFGTGNNKFVTWVQNHKRPLEWVAVAFYGLIMLLVRLTPKTLLVFALLLVLTVLCIEVVGGQAVAKKPKKA